MYCKFISHKFLWFTHHWSLLPTHEPVSSNLSQSHTHAHRHTHMSITVWLFSVSVSNAIEIRTMLRIHIHFPAGLQPATHKYIIPNTFIKKNHSWCTASTLQYITVVFLYFMKYFVLRIWKKSNRKLHFKFFNKFIIHFPLYILHAF